MKLILKGIDIAGSYLSDSVPDDLKCFSLYLTAMIGLSDQEGGSLYVLRVCTPEWLKRSMQSNSESSAFWGRHLLIVDSFDAGKIESLIQDKLEELSQGFSGYDANQLAKIVGRFAHWEFEDYKERE